MASYSHAPHLQFINPLQEGADTFPLFAKLPFDIRFEIWKSSLRQERLVRVELVEQRPGIAAEDLIRNRPRFLLRETKLVEDFLVCLRNAQEISKLFSVCQESRQAAMHFYRVKVPCYYCQRDAPPVQGTFYFNPELDILHIRENVDFSPMTTKYLPKLARMLWDHDPQRIGLAKIALTTTEVHRGFDGFFKPDDEHLLRQFLSRLRCVFFGFDGDYTGRIWPGNPDEIFRFLPKGHINRSRPLLASVSKFQRLPEDPRSIAPELKRVHLPFGDPRQQVYRWFRLLEQWQIQYEYPVEYRFMLAFRTPRVTNRDEAYLELEAEHKEWESCQQSSAKNGIECEDDFERAIPSAYGFWLFPINAFRPIPPATKGLRNTGRPRQFDMRRTKVWNHFKTWDISSSKPELCLQYLPRVRRPLSEVDAEEGLGSDVKQPCENEWRLSRPETGFRLGYFCA